MTAKVRDVGIVTWTDAEDARLRHMWAEGFSGSAIGKDMGRTRNSVIGRVFRLKLKTENHPVNHHKLRVKHEVRDKRVRRMKRNEPPKQRHHPTRPVLDGRAIPTIAIDVSALKGRAWEPLDGILPKPLELLEKRECRWPLGDGPFLFCAAGTPGLDHVYCHTHAAMSASSRPLARL